MPDESPGAAVIRLTLCRIWVWLLSWILPLPKDLDAAPIYASLIKPVQMISSEEDPADFHPWLATVSAAAVPASVIGQMVHKAI